MKNAAGITVLLMSRDDVYVGARGKDQQTPLRPESRENAAEIFNAVATMLRSGNGAEFDARVDDQRTPMHCACEKSC